MDKDTRMKHRDFFNEIRLVEQNGRIYQLHWRYRFGPAMIPIAMAAMAVGTGMQVAGSIQQGKMADKIAKQRAAVDTMNAANAKQNAMTEAQIQAEKGRRLMSTQTALAAAGGIKVNQGAPLVIEADTKSKIAQDVGYILRRGGQAEQSYLASADIERQIGKNTKKQSQWDAVGTGLQGMGSIAFMGADAGLGSNRDAYLARKHGI